MPGSPAHIGVGCWSGDGGGWGLLVVESEEWAQIEKEWRQQIQDAKIAELNLEPSGDGEEEEACDVQTARETERARHRGALGRNVRQKERKTSSHELDITSIEESFSIRTHMLSGVPSRVQALGAEILTRGYRVGSRE